MKPDALKVLIYATWRDGLLVFDEPDFPLVQWQVPGGRSRPARTWPTRPVGNSKRKRA